MMPEATMPQSAKIGTPDASAAAALRATSGVNAISSAALGMPEAWITRITISATSSGKRERSEAARTRSKDSV